MKPGDSIPWPPSGTGRAKVQSVDEPTRTVTLSYKTKGQRCRQLVTMEYLAELERRRGDSDSHRREAD